MARTVHKAVSDSSHGLAHAAISAGESFIREAKLGEQLYKYLIDLIESGKLTEGAKLPTEKQLCERFRISRPVVREALARLRMEGIVISRRGSGSYVMSPPERAALASLPRPRAAVPGESSKLANLLRCLEMRLMIECDTAYFAALRRTPEQLHEMSRALEEMDNATRTRSLDHQSHFKFHLLVSQATANQFVVGGLRLLEPYMEVCMNLLRDLWLIEPDQPIDTGDYNHQAIFEAIRDGRAEDAREAMRLHIEEARRDIFGDIAPAATPHPPRTLKGDIAA